MPHGGGDPGRPAAVADPPGELRVAALVGFTRRLAATGVPVTSERTATFLSAVRELGVTGLQVYWAGRLTLLSGPDDIPRYDRVFAQCFGGQGAPLPTVSMPPRPSLGFTDTDDDGDDGAQEGAAAPLRGRASTSEVLRHKDFAALTGSERREMAVLMALLRPGLPQRRARRRRPYPRGRFDRRRTTRAIVAAAGEPAAPRRQRATRRPRRIVLLIDVSGSMEAYADALLRFAHVLVRHRRSAVEVFTIGTRLTRVTRALAVRDPAKALAAAAATIPDYSGGTRLGEVLRAFLDRWGRRGTARGALVVVFSDGWERGSVQLLGSCAAQLRRLANRLIWVNPHKAKAGYQPVQGGIAAVAPHLDAFVSGHSLAALQELLDVLRG